jgi:hypothetical protein
MRSMWIPYIVLVVLALILPSVCFAGPLTQGGLNGFAAAVFAQDGLGGPAADAATTASLTCKDSLLLGWGGASDQDYTSCPVVRVDGPGSTLQLQGCTVQLHPDSKHTRLAAILMATDHASATASSCKLVGPAQGSLPAAAVAAAGIDATIALVSAPFFCHPSF